MMLSKKAEGGFMESIVAVIAVVITLTAFLSFLAVSLSHNDAIERDIMPADLLNDVRIVNGTIETDIEQKMIVASELNGYQGMRVILSVADGTYDSSMTVNVGSFDSDIIRSRSGTFIVKSNDGRSVPVNFVMAVWT